MGFWRSLFQRRTHGRFIEAPWESLASFSLVLPVKSRRISSLSLRLESAQSLRTELVSICRHQYFPDPLYEAILQRVAEGGGLEGDEQQYRAACERNFQELAREKIHVVVVCEEAREMLSPEALQQLTQLTDSVEDSRVIVFEQDMLMINGGWKQLISGGRWTRGRRMLFVDEGDTSLSDRHAILRRMMDPS